MLTVYPDYYRDFRSAAENRIELARMYSAGIEYSEENMDALFDALVCRDGEA